MKILALNGGSSTFKASLFDVNGSEGFAARATPGLWDVQSAWTGSIIRARPKFKSKLRAQPPPARSPSAHPSNRSTRSWKCSGAATRRWCATGAKSKRWAIAWSAAGRALRESTRIRPGGSRRHCPYGQLRARKHNRLELEAMEAMDRILGLGSRAGRRPSIPLSMPPCRSPLLRLRRAVRLGRPGHPTLWIPRHQPPIYVPPRGRYSGQRLAVSAHDHLPGLGNGASLAAIRGGASIGYHHGLHAASKWPHDGHPLGQPSIRA